MPKAKKPARKTPKAAKPKGKPGRPAHEPSAHLRNVVRYLSVGYGERQRDIAAHIGVAPHTLRKHYRQELDHAKGEIDAMAIETLVSKMLGYSDPDASGQRKRRLDDVDVQCLLFYLKTRLGFRDAPQQHEHSGVVGTFDYSKLTDEQATALEAILSAAAVVDGPAGGTSPTGG